MQRVVTAAPAQSDLLARLFVRDLVVHNPLFLLSAALVLTGAWLLNPPARDGGRSLVLLLQLFVVIQAYEGALLGAAWLLARRAGLGRDVRNLALALSPFLLDVTCTNASFVIGLHTGAGTGASLAVAALALTLAARKTALACTLTGTRLEGPLERAAALAGPALVFLYPLVAAEAVLSGAEPASVALLGGVALAGLVLVLGRAVAAGGPGAAALRALAGVALPVAVFHVGAATWALTGDLRCVAGPALLALGPVLPRLAWPSLAGRDAATPLVLPAAGAAWLGSIGGGPAGGEAWLLGLAGFGAVQAVVFARQGSLPALAGLAAALHLACGGGTLELALASLGSNPVEPVLLLGLFAYGLMRRAPAPVLGLALGAAAVLTARLRPLGTVLDFVVVLDLLGLGLLAWTHRTHGTSAAGARCRFAAAHLLFLPSCVLVVQGAPHLPPGVVETAAVTLLALFALGRLTGLRVYQVPALLLPAAACARLAPNTSAGWGAAGIALAFVLVTLGVWVSLRRERILAWLDPVGR